MKKYVPFMGTTHSILVDHCQESLKDAQVQENISLASCYINKINSAIEKNAHFIVKQLARMTNLELTFIYIFYFILKKMLKVRKISARSATIS